MVKRIVVLPDIHCPNHNSHAIQSILKFNKSYKPDVLIQLGDFCDWDSVSTYDPRREEDIVNIEHEVTQSNHLLDDIERSLPKKCRKIMIGGNHEARLTKFRAKHGFEISIRRMRELREWYQEYNLDKRDWEHCEYGEYIEVGRIVFTHGWYSSGNHAERHLRLYHKNIIYGHSHQFQVATAVGIDGKPVMSASIGTLSNFDLSYLVGKPPVNWMTMFAYFDMRDDGTFSPHFVPIVNDRFIELGKEWSEGLQ